MAESLARSGESLARPFDTRSLLRTSSLLVGRRVKSGEDAVRKMTKGMLTSSIIPRTSDADDTLCRALCDDLQVPESMLVQVGKAPKGNRDDGVFEALDAAARALEATDVPCKAAVAAAAAVLRGERSSVHWHSHRYAAAVAKVVDMYAGGVPAALAPLTSLRREASAARFRVAAAAAAARTLLASVQKDDSQDDDAAQSAADEADGEERLLEALEALAAECTGALIDCDALANIALRGGPALEACAAALWRAAASESELPEDDCEAAAEAALDALLDVRAETPRRPSGGGFGGRTTGLAKHYAGGAACALNALRTSARATSEAASGMNDDGVRVFSRTRSEACLADCVRLERDLQQHAKLRCFADGRNWTDEAAQNVEVLREALRLNDAAAHDEAAAAADTSAALHNASLLEALDEHDAGERYLGAVEAQVCFDAKHAAQQAKRAAATAQLSQAAAAAVTQLREAAAAETAKRARAVANARARLARAPEGRVARCGVTSAACDAAVEACDALEPLLCAALPEALVEALTGAQVAIDAAAADAAWGRAYFSACFSCTAAALDGGGRAALAAASRRVVDLFEKKRASPRVAKDGEADLEAARTRLEERRLTQQRFAAQTAAAVRAAVSAAAALAPGAGARQARARPAADDAALRGAALSALDAVVALALAAPARAAPPPAGLGAGDLEVMTALLASHRPPPAGGLAQLRALHAVVASRFAVDAAPWRLDAAG
ncbi:hypothetical protein M885DRAFT_511510 [Pelagophyceae sp. CCMP2097]|nr:hypothetical protein M885DRAFT_511510 [Pelagophyceae sp. CCMP2097]